jgi:hypothetical protein
MVAIMYITLKVVLDISVIRKIGSVKAQNPIDCPGKANMITMHEIAKIIQLSICLYRIKCPAVKRFDLLFQFF